MTTPTLILASASATRAGLLTRAGLAFTAQSAPVDEEAIKATFRAEGIPAVECAVALAEAKAMRADRRSPPGGFVIGADQMLVCGDRWFDKPADLDAARDQLKALRGKKHELISAVCVIRNQARIWHIADRAALTMRDFSDSFLDDYLAAEGETVTSSVGAYRLEGRGIQLFARIDGDFFSILGLPLLPLLDFLRGYGIVPR